MLEHHRASLFTCVRHALYIVTHKKLRRMSNTKMPKGNKRITFRVDPFLEEAMVKAMKEDGDKTLSAWLKRIVRKS